MSQPVYLDYAAATPMADSVKAAMAPYLSDKFHNPSATYLAGRAVRKDLEAARTTVGQCLGVKSAEIIFTAGATEANNLAINGIMRRFPKANLVVSAIEHESVLAAAGQFDCRLAPVNQQGLVDLKKLEKLIDEQTVLVSVIMVSHELGSIQPLREITQMLNMLSKLRGPKSLPLYLHTDAAQAANYLDLHTSRLGVDLLTINGSKIYGPKQTGALFVKAGLQLEPLILGGGQESGLRSGTENVAGGIGLAAALEKAQTLRKREAKRVGALRQLFIEQLSKQLPTAVINGSAKHQAPHIVSVSFPGIDNERLMMELDEHGIQVALGSACSASSQKPSPVLAAIGLNDRLARSTLRFSFGRPTTTSHIKKTISLLKRLTDSQA